jgi:hypothetical protein
VGHWELVAAEGKGRRVEELEEERSSLGSAITEPSRLLFREGELPRIRRAPFFCPSTAIVAPKIWSQPAMQSSPAAGAAVGRREQGKGKARAPPLAASPPSSPCRRPRAPPLRVVLRRESSLRGSSRGGLLLSTPAVSRGGPCRRK